MQKYYYLTNSFCSRVTSEQKFSTIFEDHERKFLSRPFALK